MKEAPNSPYNKLLFRATFRSEAETRKQASSVTDVIFENGKGVFNGTSSKINYNLGLNGTYSVRIRCNPTSFVASQYIIDSRGTNNDGTGYLGMYVSSGILFQPSGTAYVNGIATSTTTAGVNNEIVIAGITLKQGTGANLTLISGNYANSQRFNGDIDLFEIYEGTLTASEVKNLYENKWNKEVSGYGGQPGSNVVTNGTFDTDSSWNKGAGWTISGGKASCACTAISSLTQSNLLVAGKKYLLKFDVLDGDADRIGLTNTGISTTSYNIGSHELTFTATTTGALTFFGYTGDTPFSIDNVIVQELQPDLLLDFDSTRGTLSDKTVGNILATVLDNDYDLTTWTPAGSVNNITSNSFTTISSPSGVYNQSVSMVIGKKYRISVKGNTTGSVKITDTGNNTSGVPTLTGDFNTSYEVTWSGTVRHYILNTSVGTTTIDRLVIQEIKPPLTSTDVSIKKIGQSYSADFNGNTSKIDTGNDMIGTKAVTVCGWINYRGGQIQPRIIDNANVSASVVLANRRFNVTSDNYATNAVTAVNSILYNTWQFIVFTRTNTGLVNIYFGTKNSAPSISGAPNQASGTPTAGTTNVIIGNNSGATRTFNGNISELKVYENILSLEDITQIWSESRKNYI